MPNNERITNFVFTCNNYTSDHETLIQNIPSSYLIYGKEIAPTTGTPHLQGYCQLPNGRSHASLKKSLPGFFIKKAQGNCEQNRVYCSKSGDVFESGVPGDGQGKRNDLLSMYDDIKSGLSDYDVMERQPVCYMRHYRAADRVRFLFEQRKYVKFQPLEVIVRYGPANHNKTRWVYDTYGDSLFRPALPAKLGDQLWWDGLSFQETVLLDDFYGEIPYSLLLQILDGYPMNLPVKGGFVIKKYKRVIITSNEHPDYWYKSQFPMGMSPALSRRISKIVNAAAEGAYITPSATSVPEIGDMTG